LRAIVYSRPTDLITGHFGMMPEKGRNRTCYFAEYDQLSPAKNTVIYEDDADFSTEKQI
jgi:hypothetical protein